MQSTVTPNHRISGHYASVYPSQHDANLVLSALRHQRDLFSGGAAPGTSLGIPDVNTHVGSVIHAFENLAHQRHLKESGERPYESSKSTSSTSRKESLQKIFLPPPPKTSTGTITDPVKKIVRPRPKTKAPPVPSSSNTASATTQTTKFSGDDNESSNLDSLNLEDDYRKTITTPATQHLNKFPQSYIKNYKVLPPFVPPRQPSRIPTKTMSRTNNQQSARNRMSDSMLASKVARTDVYLKPNSKYTTEDDVENDFLRGSTVSQSFIKNVVRKSPTRKISTYEQNFLIDPDGPSNIRKSFDQRPQNNQQRSRSTSAKVEQPLIDEVSLRFKEYSSNNDLSSLRNSSRLHNFQPRSIDRAEL